MELFVFSAMCVLILNVCVQGIPLENQMRSKMSDIQNTSVMSDIQNGGSTNTSEKSVAKHKFVKFDNLRNRNVLPNEANLKLSGFSSMRMLSPAEIDHPSFDPNNFLRVAGSENTQQIEVLPVVEQPYFMFIPQEMLKNDTYKDGIFSNAKRRRVKRHHPGVLQNVLGELQNFALVPIKSANGQIRYILLKNPKFVIGNPQENGQLAPTVVQLNSNQGVSSTSGQIRYTPKAPVTPVTKPPYRNEPAITLHRHPWPVPHASSIDSVFSSPTRASTIRPQLEPTYTTKTRAGSHFSAPIVHMEPLRAHHHGKHSVTPTKGDTTVQKTEVVETVVETQKAEAAVAKQETAAASSASSQSQTVSTGSGFVGDTGTVNVESAAAAASQSAAASASSAAKEEKVVKKTKKTTTVVKSGNDPTSPSGGGAVQHIQVVEETVHEGASSSVAASSEAAAVSAESVASSATTGIAGSKSADKTKGDVSAASASSASSSSASAAETNSTTTVKKKTIKKTTTITKSTDTSGLAGMNSELPKAILSDISTKSKIATTKKPPTAILSDSNAKMSTINTQAVLIATDKPKLAAPMIIITTTEAPITDMTTTVKMATTEEVEVEAEEMTTQATIQNTTTMRGNTAPNKTTVQPKRPVPAKTHTFDLGQGYEIFFDGQFISFKPITANNGQPTGKLGNTLNNRQSPLGRVLGGQGGALVLTLNNKTQTLGGKVAGWAGGPVTEPPLGPNDRMNTTDVPEEIEALPDKRTYIPMQNYNLPIGYLPPRDRPLPGLGVAGWAKNPTTPEPALGPNDRINTTDVPEEIEARPDKTRAQRRALLKRMNPGFSNAQIEAQLVRDDKARAKMAKTQTEPVVLLPEPPSLPVPPTPIKPKGNARKRNNKANSKRVLKARRRKQKVPRRKKPRPTTTTTAPEPTYPPTYPTTTDLYPPTTYPTPATFNYATNPTNQQYQQQQFQPYQQQQYQNPQQQYQQQQYQPPQQQYQQQQQYNPQQQQQFQPQQQQQYQPQQQQQQFQQQQQQYQPQQQQSQPAPQQQNNQPRNRPNKPNRPNRPNRRGNQQRRNRKPPPKKIGRRRQRQYPRTTTEAEEVAPRDPIAHWFLNNMDAELLDSFLPFLAMG